MLRKYQIKSSRISEFLDKSLSKRLICFLIVSWSLFSRDTSWISCISSFIKYEFLSICTFLRNSSKNIFITYTSLVRSGLSFFLTISGFFSDLPNKNRNIFYDTISAGKTSWVSPIKTLSLSFTNLKLESSVSCLAKHPWSFAAASSSMHLTRPSKSHDLESSFLDVEHTNPIYLDDDNLLCVNAVSEWKKGNTSVHGKADNFWRHQRFGSKILLP